MRHNILDKCRIVAISAFIKINLWLALWIPLFVILNSLADSMFVSFIEKSGINASGITLLTVDKIRTEGYRILGYIGAASWTVPALAWAILKGGEYAVTHALSMVTGGTTSGAGVAQSVGAQVGGMGNITAGGFSRNALVSTTQTAYTTTHGVYQEGFVRAMRNIASFMGESLQRATMLLQQHGSYVDSRGTRHDFYLGPDGKFYTTGQRVGSSGYVAQAATSSEGLGGITAVGPEGTLTIDPTGRLVSVQTNILGIEKAMAEQISNALQALNQMSFSQQKTFLERFTRGSITTDTVRTAREKMKLLDEKTVAQIIDFFGKAGMQINRSEAEAIVKEIGGTADLSGISRLIGKGKVGQMIAGLLAKLTGSIRDIHRDIKSEDNYEDRGTSNNTQIASRTGDSDKRIDTTSHETAKVVQRLHEIAQEYRKGISQIYSETISSIKSSTTQITTNLLPMLVERIGDRNFYFISDPSDRYGLALKYVTNLALTNPQQLQAELQAIMYQTPEEEKAKSNIFNQREKIEEQQIPPRKSK
ncbi:conjugal transfer protein TraG N-terminal domain-containing protein [Thermodesulfovibrio hydrogeniphilus]